jgi:hypothetical protein
MRKFPSTLKKEFRIFKKLNSPKKIQNFLDTLPINLEEGGRTCRSPLEVLERKEVHCIEGAMFSAACLWFHGERPLLLDLRSVYRDNDHVVALFRQAGHWGAISKTNHAVLRYREPAYRTIRELAMSYFHEYFLDNGAKTLRTYSTPLNLLRYGPSWLTDKKNLTYISEDLDDSPHFELLPENLIRRLRKADKIEIEAGKLVEWKKWNPLRRTL